MRCGLAYFLFASSLSLLVVARLSGRKQPHILPTATQHQQQSPGCPANCACEAGDASNGGVSIANGLCYDFCSSPLENSDVHTKVRYCGQGADYQRGDYLDCRECIKPEYFKGSYTVHEPEVKWISKLQSPRTGSIILLGPWNASEGWGMRWIMNSSEAVDPNIRKHNRIVDVVGRQVMWEGYGKVTAWYGYPDVDSWYKNVPVAREVDHSIAYVHNLIEQEYSIVGDYRRIILVGLHQGANIALEAALRFHQPLGLVFSQRGIVLPSRLESREKVAMTPCILTAGGRDDVYPDTLIKKNAESLKTLQVPVFMKTMPEFDHFKWSKEESSLALKSFLVAMSEAPASKKTLSQLTDWTVAS